MTARAPDALGHMGPLTSTIAVTTSDSTIYSPPLRGILIGSAGTLKLQYADGTEDTFASGHLAAGVFHPLYDVVMVFATGTSATGIHAGR